MQLADLQQIEKHLHDGVRPVPPSDLNRHGYCDHPYDCPSCCDVHGGDHRDNRHDVLLSGYDLHHLHDCRDDDHHDVDPRNRGRRDRDPKSRGHRDGDPKNYDRHGGGLKNCDHHDGDLGNCGHHGGQYLMSMAHGGGPGRRDCGLLCDDHVHGGHVRRRVA